MGHIQRNHEEQVCQILAHILFCELHPNQQGIVNLNQYRSIFAFQPLGKGMSGKLLAICLAFRYAQEFSVIKPVTKSTPSGLSFIGLHVGNHL